MTPSDLIDFALGILSEYSDEYPTTKSVMYQRLNLRQNELFSMAAMWDREFFGVEATATLDNRGCADLSKMQEAGIFPIERLDKLEILDSGTNTAVDNGDEVNIVPGYDAAAHLPPRVTVRSGILSQVGEDLNGVTSLKVLYSRKPKEIDLKGEVGGEADQPVEIPSPWNALLAWDLARDIIRRSTAMDAEKMAGILELIGAVEADLMGGFENHVKGFAHARQERFDV